MVHRKCVLLINLGSPDRPDKRAIRGYLKEFLSDPRVMDIPKTLRWMILRLFILPFRPGSILPKYQRIWKEDRFLLMRHSEDLAESLSDSLGAPYTVRLAMRYGSPSIVEALQAIEREGVEELIIVPLFPQYASATAGSIIEKVLGELRSWLVHPQIRVVSQFFKLPGFIEAWRQVATPFIEQHPDHVLFSFHGLPESHIIKADFSGNCLETADCCLRMTDVNQHCYRAQCFQTAHKIAASLNISESRYSIAFQSRMGRGRWIGPATSEVIEMLAAQNVKELLVLCPSFVADCLETVEEIGEEERTRFVSLGGRGLTLVPSLNSHPAWVEALVSLVRK